MNRRSPAEFSCLQLRRAMKCCANFVVRLSDCLTKVRSWLEAMVMHSSKTWWSLPYGCYRRINRVAYSVGRSPYGHDVLRKSNHFFYGRPANTHSQWPRMYSGSLGWLMPTGFPAAWKHGVGNCVPMQLVALIRECLTILHRLPSPKSGSDFAKAIGRAGETAKNR